MGEIQKPQTNQQKAGVTQEIPFRVPALLGKGQGSSGAVNGQNADQRQDDDDKPNPFVAFETGSELCIHAIVWGLEVSYSFFELAAAVFVAIEQVETRASGRQQNHIALVGHF